MYKANPPILNVLPVAMICGLVTLNPSQYANQIKLGTSFYVATANECRIFVGLKQFAPDMSSADYYWFVVWHDDSVTSEHWVVTASDFKRLEFARNIVRERQFHPAFQEILGYQDVDQMLPSLVIRDRVPTVGPDGPVTLIGDASHPMSFCMSYLIPPLCFPDSVIS